MSFIRASLLNVLLKIFFKMNQTEFGSDITYNYDMSLAVFKDQEYLSISQNFEINSWKLETFFMWIDWKISSGRDFLQKLSISYVRFLGAIFKNSLLSNVGAVKGAEELANSEILSLPQSFGYQILLGNK